MPPRKPSAKRNKPSTKPPTPVVDPQQSPPKSTTDPKLNDTTETETDTEVMQVLEQASDSIAPETVAVGSVDETTVVENEEEEEGAGLADRVVDGVIDDGGVVVADQDPEDAEESVDEEEEFEAEEEDEEEENEEIVSVQEEITAVQVDASETLNDNNNHQDTDISKNNDVLVVNNGAVSTQPSHEDNTALAVEDESMLNMDSEEIDDYSEGDDDADNEGQDPLSIVQDSIPDNNNNNSNNKEKGTEIYVGKLDKNAVEDDLVSVFQQFGELISTRIVRKPNSNKSKGFGFVRFASVDQAQRALSELKDGVEVRGKPITISASQDNDTLYLGNICKTWDKEQVTQKLKEYGIENIAVLRVPEDSKLDRKNKGFAFLEFSNHSDAVDAFQRLKKPDVFFGRDENAKVAFSQTPLHSKDADLSNVNEVHLEGLTKDWNEEKVKDLCNKYGEIVNINLCPGKRNKRRDFGFVTFNSSESALACVEGINNTDIEGEAKIKVSLAKPQQKSQPKSSKMKGVSNTQQTTSNKRRPSKNKINNTVKPQQIGPVKKDGESSKEAELSKMKGDNENQKPKRKRKPHSEQKSSARDLGAQKKQRNGGQGQNSQPAGVSRAGSNKRKNPIGNEIRGDRGNRNAQGRKPFKRQRDNFRISRSDTHARRGHDDYRNPNRYAPYYAASASNAYHMASDHSLRYKEMEPHAGYIEPAYGKQSGSYSGYVQQPIVQAPHAQYQTVYQPSSASQSYSRYVDRPVMTQSHRGYIEAPVAREVQPYRDYHHPPANVQIARDHYDPGHARIVRHDDRGAGVLTYVGGPPHQPSQVPDHTSYYQAGGSYGGGYGNRGSYY